MQDTINPEEIASFFKEQVDGWARSDSDNDASKLQEIRQAYCQLPGRTARTFDGAFKTWLDSVVNQENMLGNPDASLLRKLKGLQTAACFHQKVTHWKRSDPEGDARKLQEIRQAYCQLPGRSKSTFDGAFKTWLDSVVNQENMLGDPDASLLRKLNGLKRAIQAADAADATAGGDDLAVKMEAMLQRFAADAGAGAGAADATAGGDDLPVEMAAMLQQMLSHPGAMQQMLSNTPLMQRMMQAAAAAAAAGAAGAAGAADAGAAATGGAADDAADAATGAAVGAGAGAATGAPGAGGATADAATATADAGKKQVTLFVAAAAADDGATAGGGNSKIDSTGCCVIG